MTKGSFCHLNSWSYSLPILFQWSFWKRLWTWIFCHLLVTNSNYGCLVKRRYSNEILKISTNLRIEMQVWLFVASFLFTLVALVALCKIQDVPLGADCHKLVEQKCLKLISKEMSKIMCELEEEYILYSDWQKPEQWIKINRKGSLRKCMFVYKGIYINNILFVPLQMRKLC